MVDVAQLVEPRIVIPVVAGSIPVVHPSLVNRLQTPRYVTSSKDQSLVLGAPFD